MKRAYNIIAGRTDEPPMYIGIVIAPSLMQARRLVNPRVFKSLQQPDYVKLEHITTLPDETPDYCNIKVVYQDAQIIP